MNDQETIELRRRIRELLSIPDRDRTDAEWDELNELEIRTAPGNRDSERGQPRATEKRSGSPGQPRRHGPKGGGNRPETRQDNRTESRPEGGTPPVVAKESRPDGQGRTVKRQHRRPKRPVGDASGGVATPQATPSGTPAVPASSAPAANGSNSES